MLAMVVSRGRVVMFAHPALILDGQGLGLIKLAHACGFMLVGLTSGVFIFSSHC